MRLLILTAAALAVATSVGASGNQTVKHYVPCPPHKLGYYVPPTLPPPPPVCP